MKFLNSIFLLTAVAVNSVRGEVKYFEKCINDGDFAITFDDGPNLETSNKVLDILDEFDVKATFFVNGKNCVDVRNNKEAQDIIKREYNSGHVVASHTYTHPSGGITGLSDDELYDELTKVNELLDELIGVKPSFFRPPLGEYSESNLKIIEKCGIKANILWNLDSEDWDSSYNATQQYIDGLEGKDPYTHSFIALNHDIQKVTANKNLRIIIPYIKNLGYNLVTMDVCTGIPAYQNGKTVPSKPKVNDDKPNNDPNKDFVYENPQYLSVNNNTNNSETNGTTNDPNGNAKGTGIDSTNSVNSNLNNNSSDANTLKSSLMFTTAIMSLITYLLL